MPINRPFKLKNTIQKYAWGSHTAIQQLLGAPRVDEPWAELWMGAHPKAPSLVLVDNQWLSLPDFISRFPDEILGPDIAIRYNHTLPYLFKVLAAAKPLSIQAHPDARQAKAGFERETANGPDIHSPARNYKDANHKPECICALTPFTGLKGFRKIEVSVELLESFCPRSLAYEISLLRDKKLKSFFQSLMELPATKKQTIIDEVMDRVETSGVPDTICRWIQNLHHHFPNDIGVISPLFLNLFQLAPGQALFLPAGELHAYLDGLGIELMANSDNVLRGGLTSKHVDVKELMNILTFDESEIKVLTPHPVSGSEFSYPILTEEFRLSVVHVTDSTPHTASEQHSAEILLCVHGNVHLDADGFECGGLDLRRGDSVLIPAALKTYRIHGTGDIYKAGIPMDVPPQHL